MSASAEGFGVYIHWPFCAAKCPYCDFNSHVRHKPVDQNLFAEAYQRELAHLAQLAPARTVTSIFFGGGTPSLMEDETVAGLIDAISANWPVADTCEITLEANPSSVEAGKFEGYRKAGVNRVSLGVQSLIEEELRFLGRLHTADEASRAVEIAASVFDRVSCDLIYARPDQSVGQWVQELEQAISLGSGHLSLYQLTIEEGTRFFDLHRAGKLVVPGEETAAELYEATQSVTSKHGLEAYEISNHAKPGQECQHNLIYWRGQDYAGTGPGAHGRLTTGSGRLATATIRNPEAWWQQVMVSGHGMEEQSVLLNEEHADELLLMGLRLAEGFDPARYEQLQDRKLDPERCRFLEDAGFIETLPNGRFRATAKGFLVLDAVVADLAA